MGGSGSGRTFFVGGNFKMNGNRKKLQEIVERLNKAELDAGVEVVVAPPSLYLLSLHEKLRKEIALAGQNTYIDDEGAYTGEISPWMLAEESIPWVILGHSERRSIFKESEDHIAEKTVAALKNKLKVIFCVGESLQEREADKTLQVVESQLDELRKAKVEWSDIVIAYEPVWAIGALPHMAVQRLIGAQGTGKVATPQQAQDVHADIRKWLGKAVSDSVAKQTRIIYGGSVNAKNCIELGKQPDIDGFLVGGASLKPEFLDIIAAHSKL